MRLNDFQAVRIQAVDKVFAAAGAVHIRSSNHGIANRGATPALGWQL